MLRRSYGGIGEVVNAPDCDSGMHGFKSHMPPHFLKIAATFYNVAAFLFLTIEY